jgi:hypothetical protein
MTESLAAWTTKSLAGDTGSLRAKACEISEAR